MSKSDGTVHLAIYGHLRAAWLTERLSWSDLSAICNAALKIPIPRLYEPGLLALRSPAGSPARPYVRPPALRAAGRPARPYVHPPGRRPLDARPALRPPAGPPGHRAAGPPSRLPAGPLGHQASHSALLPLVRRAAARPYARPFSKTLYRRAGKKRRAYP